MDPKFDFNIDKLLPDSSAQPSFLKKTDSKLSSVNLYDNKPQSNLQEKSQNDLFGKNERKSSLLNDEFIPSFLSEQKPQERKPRQGRRAGLSTIASNISFDRMDSFLVDEKKAIDQNSLQVSQYVPDKPKLTRQISEVPPLLTVADQLRKESISTPVNNQERKTSIFSNQQSYSPIKDNAKVDIADFSSSLNNTLKDFLTKFTNTQSQQFKEWQQSQSQLLAEIQKMSSNSQVLESKDNETIKNLNQLLNQFKNEQSQYFSEYGKNLINDLEQRTQQFLSKTIETETQLKDWKKAWESMEEQRVELTNQKQKEFSDMKLKIEKDQEQINQEKILLEQERLNYKKLMEGEYSQLSQLRVEKRQINVEILNNERKLSELKERLIILTEEAAIYEDLRPSVLKQEKENLKLRQEAAHLKSEALKELEQAKILKTEAELQKQLIDQQKSALEQERKDLEAQRIELVMEKQKWNQEKHLQFKSNIFQIKQEKRRKEDFKDFDPTNFNFEKENLKFQKQLKNLTFDLEKKLSQKENSDLPPIEINKLGNVDEWIQQQKFFIEDLLQQAMILPKHRSKKEEQDPIQT